MRQSQLSGRDTNTAHTVSAIRSLTTEQERSGPQLRRRAVVVLQDATEASLALDVRRLERRRRIARFSAASVR